MFARTILDLHGDLERITKNGKKMEQRDKRDHVLSLDRLNRFVSTGKSEPAITRACARGIRKQKRCYDHFSIRGERRKRNRDQSLKKERVVRSSSDSNFRPLRESSSQLSAQSTGLCLCPRNRSRVVECKSN